MLMMRLTYQVTPKNGKPSLLSLKFNMHHDSLSSFCGGCWLYKPVLIDLTSTWGDQVEHGEVHEEILRQLLEYGINKAMYDDDNRVIAFFSDSDGEGSGNPISFWSMRDKFNWTESEQMTNPNSGNEVLGWMTTKERGSPEPMGRLVHETSTAIYELYED